MSIIRNHESVEKRIGDYLFIRDTNTGNLFIERERNSEVMARQTPDGVWSVPNKAGDAWVTCPESSVFCENCIALVRPEHDLQGCGCHCPKCDATL